MSKYNHNLPSLLSMLIQVYGVEKALEVLDILLTQELETIDDLVNSITDELYYSIG